MIRHFCKSCAWFHDFEETNQGGECHRYAPRPILDTLHSEVQFWPQVHQDDWCAEHSDVPQ